MNNFKYIIYSSNNCEIMVPDQLIRVKLSCIIIKLTSFFYYVIMELPQSQDRDLLNLWTEFNSEPSPYLSPIHWPTPQGSPLVQDYLPAIDIDPLYSCPMNEILPVPTTSEELEMVQIDDEVEKSQEGNVAEIIKNQYNIVPVTLIKSQSRIKSLIHLLVENDYLPSEDLNIYGAQLLKGEDNLKQVFQILLNKFKKLKKTKQQMTKYCMRKAFKFVSDMKNSNKSISLKKKNSHKMYDEDESDGIVQLPFKKNSSQKTMNSQFLRQVFSRKQFVNGYKKFLQNIHETIDEDNKAKIEFLTQTIQNCLRTKDLKKIQALKRLPWSKSILTKTEQLAHQLLQTSIKQNTQGQQKQDN